MDFISAIGLVLVLEGCVYALFPSGVKRMMAAAQDLPPRTLRAGGLAAALAGLIIVYVARRLITS